MKDNCYEVIRNEEITLGTYLLTVAGDTHEIKCPGQFVNIKLEGVYLRRPMSIAYYDDEGFTIIYKVVGQGTDTMSRMSAGENFMALAPLGNGFDMEDIPNDAMLVGGGAGAMPIYKLAIELVRKGKRPHVIIGFNNKEEMFYADEFAAIDCDLTIATMDGSVGVRGTVLDAMRDLQKNDETTDEIYACACGPVPMMKAVSEISTDGQFDLGARMACGFGACMGCTIETKKGPMRVCKDGPIFKQEDIVW